jgi:hypothetical protein
MARFDPTRSRGLLRSVRFSRCLFAQLLHQQFQPPAVQKFVLPPATDPLYKVIHPFRFDVFVCVIQALLCADYWIQAATLGMKLTCGFELLCATDEASAGKRLLPSLPITLMQTTQT